VFYCVFESFRVYSQRIPIFHLLVIVPSLMNHRLGNMKELRRCVFWLDLDCRNDGHQWIYCSSMSTFFLVFYIFSNWWHLLDGLNFSLLYRSLWSVLRRQYKDTHNNKSRFSFFFFEEIQSAFGQWTAKVGTRHCLIFCYNLATVFDYFLIKSS
jgi:hypothetical protein